MLNKILWDTFVRQNILDRLFENVQDHILNKLQNQQVATWNNKKALLIENLVTKNQTR